MMTLAQSSTVVVPQMEGVTTAIVAFIFVCVVYPKLVKNKPQFYGAFAAVLVIILLHSLNVMLGTSGFQVFAGAITGLLQFGAIILLFLSAGGISMRELTGDMVRAYEVIRRGEEEKTVIIPIGSEHPRPRQQSQNPIAVDVPPAQTLDLPPDGAVGSGWPTKKPDAQPPQ